MEKPAKRIYHNGNERVWRALFRCMLDPNVRVIGQKVLVL